MELLLFKHAVIRSELTLRFGATFEGNISQITSEPRVVLVLRSPLGAPRPGEVLLDLLLGLNIKSIY